jgi:isocitrate/isopropylmalate dehydrogenase
VVESALDVLAELAPTIDVEMAPVGRDVLARDGHPLGSQARDALERNPDGILFGATGTRPGEASAVLALRQFVGSRCSLRPAGLTPETAPVTVYRELTEGLYGGSSLREDGLAEATRTITRDATCAFARRVFDRLPSDAQPTVAHKATVLDATDQLFLDTVREVAESRGRPLEDRLVDALAHDIAREPDEDRWILAPNLYGDILSDLVAGLHGGLGLAPSLTLGEGPPIAEPVHGTAPDLDPVRANPCATLASLGLLLTELGHEPEARRLQAGLQRALDETQGRTPDLGGQATLRETTRAVLAHAREVSP